MNVSLATPSFCGPQIYLNAGIIHLERPAGLASKLLDTANETIID